MSFYSYKCIVEKHEKQKGDEEIDKTANQYKVSVEQNGCNFNSLGSEM